jgi:hypothetical protein
MRFSDFDMRKNSMIDDVEMNDVTYYGVPIMFENPHIRRMLNLAKAKRTDVFYDLGSGWAQNLIIALTEFDVKEAVGIENTDKRVLLSRERLSHWGIPEKQGRIIKGNFNRLFNNKLKNANIKDATIVFYGLGTDKQIFDDLDKSLSNNCRLVYYYNALFPEIMPDRVDFPFFVSEKPFTYTTSPLKWLSKVTLKNKSSLPNMKQLTEEELWDEMRHDYDTFGFPEEIKRYKNRLKKFLEK